MFLGNVHFRSATGRGKLTGAYRKRVIPLSATPLAPLVDVTPAHLARFNAAVSVATPAAPAHVVIMSDSWGNPNQRIGEHSQFEEQLRRALRAQYGSDADCINIVNRAIGGTTWEDAAGIPDESLPPWYTDGGADWLDYITTMDLTDDGFGAAEVPSLIILMFGMNQPEAMTAADFDWIEHVLDTLQAVSPQPDILMVAGATPSSMSATRGTRAAQEARLSYAGTTRAFAAVRNLGVIDFGRYFDAAHWGEDLRRGYFVRLAEEEVTALTYTWPQECRDFAFQMTVDGTDADFWATGDLVIQLSDVIGNTLVLDEDVALGRGQVAFHGPLKKGANTRKAGEDVMAGDRILAPGRVLTPADLALIAAVGVAEVTVRVPLKVGVLSTGDEIVDPGTPAAPGQIYDANRPMLLAMLARFGFDPVDLGKVPDDREVLRARLDRAAGDVQAVLTSGGASAGDEDHVSALLRETGALQEWRIALKPGRPLALGMWQGMPVFGLPGNPVAAMVCTLIFARPALGLLAGRGWEDPWAVDVPAAFEKNKKPGRREYLRARLRDGKAEVFKSEGSGRISGLSWAEGLVELEDGARHVRPGDPVRFLPFAAFGL